MTAPTLLIAGATGTNGRPLVARLKDRGVSLRALVRDARKAADLAGGTVELAVGDLADRGSLVAAMQGIETAYVVTAVCKDTVALLDNFFAAARDAGVRRVVKFSGLRADATSPSEIIRQHGESDDALRASGLQWTLLRPNSFYQNLLAQAQGIAATGQFYLPLGDARQSMIDVRDIAEVTAKILTEPGHDNRAYDLTGPESLSMHDVAAQLGEVLDRPVTYVPVPVEAAEQAMRDAGLPEWDAHAVAEIQALFATGLYAEITEDTARLLGRTPRTFLDFARDHAGAFR